MLVGGPEALPAPGRLPPAPGLRPPWPATTSCAPISPRPSPSRRTTPFCCGSGWTTWRYWRWSRTAGRGRSGSPSAAPPRGGPGCQGPAPLPPGRPPEDLARLGAPWRRSWPPWAAPPGWRAGRPPSWSASPPPPGRGRTVPGRAGRAGRHAASRWPAGDPTPGRPNPRTPLGPGKLSEVLLLALRRGASCCLRPGTDPRPSPLPGHRHQGDLKFLTAPS